MYVEQRLGVILSTLWDSAEDGNASLELAGVPESPGESDERRVPQL